MGTLFFELGHNTKIKCNWLVQWQNKIIQETASAFF
jgi:hypothetical protein